METWLRFDESCFGILDKWAIMCILKWMNVQDVLALKKCSKRIHIICNKFLLDRWYKTDYLQYQEQLLNNDIKYYTELIQNLKARTKDVLKYQRTHANIKPDGYMKIFHSKCIQILGPWDYRNVEFAVGKCGGVKCSSSFKHVCRIHVFIKTGQSEKVYNKITAKMNKYGWQRVFVPRSIATSTYGKEIQMMFAPKNSTLFRKFYRCKVCKGDHALHDCKQVTCNICKKKGHLTRNCKHAKCKLCKTVGKHITSRCPNIVCKRCYKKGHVFKRCHKRKV